MQITPEFVETVENNYLRILIQQLKLEVIDWETAKIITKDFLGLLPFSSEEDVKNKLGNFSRTHPQFIDLEIVFLKQEEEANTLQMLDQMRNLLHQNKIDEALQLTK